MGAITASKILALMTMDAAMDAAAFQVYVSKRLVPQPWQEAVVVMDHLPAHKVEVIAPLIEAIGARVLYLSPYSPAFNPTEHWWSQLKAFLQPFSFAFTTPYTPYPTPLFTGLWLTQSVTAVRQFSPTTANRVDTLMAAAVDLMNSQHLRNWVVHGCYCPS